MAFLQSPHQLTPSLILDLLAALRKSGVGLTLRAGQGSNHCMGRITDKLRREFKRTLAQKVVSYEAIRRGEENAEKIETVGELVSQGRHPLHAIYSNTANLTGLLLEELAVLPFLHRVAKFVETVQEDYTPGYPPMSPITVTSYMTWLLYDVRFGLDQETIGDCFYGISDLLDLDPVQIEAALKLSRSRTGLYEARPGAPGHYHLRELITGIEIEAFLPSGYTSARAALMLVRLGPPLAGMDSPWVGLTTPYVLAGTSEQEWLDYFQRHGIMAGAVGSDERLHQHLKYGPDNRYWMEYLFNGYVNHRSDRIWLTGFPDRPETLPHHDKFDPATFRVFELKE